MRILFYGTASYDKESFDKELPAYPDVSIEYTETNLTPLTASLARGYDAVCAFVNANVGALTLEVLAGLGVKLVLMRCAGFDAVNVNMAKDLGITVTLELNEDGTAALVIFGEKAEGEWEAKSATEGTFKAEDAAVDMKIADGKLTMEQNGEKLVFEKAEAAAGSSAAASDSAASESASSSSSAS